MAPKKAASKTQKSKAPRSMPKKGQDPRGGLTAAGRTYFKQKEGSNLRPGVRGPADTPEKMLRKGSFLRRHYANPRGPVLNEKGEPTRQALQAAAWGEPVPKTTADERTLADKGKQLLTRYHEAKGDAKGARGGKAVGSQKRAPAKRAGSKTAVGKQTAKTRTGAGSSARGAKAAGVKKRASAKGKGSKTSNGVR